VGLMQSSTFEWRVMNIDSSTDDGMMRDKRLLKLVSSEY
jgi:hypothetical protein